MEEQVNESQLDLSVGETLRIGEYLVTIEDIHGDEIQFHIDSLDGPIDVEEDFPPRDSLPPR